MRARARLGHQAGYLLNRLVLGACALLAAGSFALGMNGRWQGFVGAVLWIIIGAVAFRYLWQQPDRRH